jgi:hypothetical protein
MAPFHAGSLGATCDIGNTILNLLLTQDYCSNML